jgi:hemerythrin-like domain-containing protein
MSTRTLGPIEDLLTADHARLDALLERADRGGTIDTTAYAELRAGLLRHIAMEEKVLLRDAAQRRGGMPLAIAREVHRDHGKIAALLVPTPTHALCEELRRTLDAHDALEEGAEGVYAACDALAGESAREVVARLSKQPEVPMAKHYDGPLVGIQKKRMEMDVADPVAHLLACHERIRSFVGVSARIASTPTAPHDDIAEAVARVRRYFTVALPLHEQDEELSILPRLMHASWGAQVGDALAIMTADHAKLRAILDELDASWRVLADDPAQIASLAPRLAVPQRALEELFERHLAMEETTIFPSLSRVLHPETLTEIAAEIRARRTSSTQAT